ncbi:unnamed protein product [Malus baccata var. baccata]
MDLRESIINQNDVARRLTKQLVQTEGKQSNLVYSPLSIHVVLSLIAAGSKGPTQEQLLAFLKSKSTDHLNSFASQLVSVIFSDGSPVGGPKLAFANGVWVHKPLTLKPSFKQVVDASYKAALALVDFQTNISSQTLCHAAQVASGVNSWAEKETSGLIKDLLPPRSLDSSTRLIFTNALYFKGVWTEKFDASATKEHDFHLLDWSTVKAPFMTSKRKQYVSAFDDKRRFSVHIFLPQEKDGLPALVEKLGSESGFLDRYLPKQPVAVGDFRIPKFKISFGLGLVLPFEGEGGLTEMVDSPEGKKLYVSSIFHKSFIEVNEEEGTEAAAASAGVISQRSMPMTFVADRPFLFTIREETTGTVLFIGNLLNPLAG